MNCLKPVETLAAVSLTNDKDNFDQEVSDPAQAKHFDITVDFRSSTAK